MLELGSGADLFRAAGWVYISIALFAVALALWLPKLWWGKVAAAVVVLGIASIVPMKAGKEISQKQVKVDDYQQRYAMAKALFDERCKTAGEKIYRTVDNVEGVLLLNVREERQVKGVYDPYSDPMLPDAGLPYELTGNGYIHNFIQPKFYDLVDVKLPNGGFERHRRVARENDLLGYFDFKRAPLADKPARYAVDFTNEINPDDRKHWIAGTTIRVTDTQTGEALAVRRSYAFESGFGSHAGDRMPWLFSETCPKSTDRYITSIFVKKVLKPIQGK